MELATDALELQAHGQLRSIEVDVVPSEPEHFSPTQAEHEDQGVGGIERIVVRGC